MLGVCVGSVYMAYKSLVAFLVKEEQHDEYRRYLRYTLDTIEEHSTLFRLELVKQIGVSHPGSKELSSALFNLENSMNSIRVGLKDFLEVE
jgi:hypothetical protein